MSLYDNRPDGADSSPAPEILAHTGVPSGSAMRATRVTSSPLMALPRFPCPPAPILFLSPPHRRATPSSPHRNKGPSPEGGSLSLRRTHGARSMYFTDRGIEELEKRRGEEEVTFEWLAEQLRTFVDLNPDFEVPVERLATWLARLDDEDDE
ncbi:hypothetical protein GCM10010269_44520 [Streptomyces humidus]|uniref:Uncharacterized protein n=133 Tax=Actinomycetes TaxID=1760 RepID=A0A918L4L6_9ACTN|nr:hypothetical protein GCM10010269_44520 [Streptomyces humidus]